MSYDQHHGTDVSEPASSTGRAAAPGKRTLTQGMAGHGSAASTAPGDLGPTAEAASSPASADPFALHLGAVQRAADGDGALADDAGALVSAASADAGAPLPTEARGRFESSLGVDLSAVRVHTDSTSARAAEAVQAKAYTVGQDIHFGAGHADLGAPGGRELLAHEVAHTVQQRGASTTQFKLEVSQPDDALEVEADQVAGAMVAGTPASVSPISAGLFRRVMREPTHGAAHVGGGETAGVPMRNQQDTADIQVGQAGYSRQMLRSTAELAGDIGSLEEVQNLLVQPVAPDFTGIDQNIVTRQDDVRRMQAWLDDESGFFGHHQSKVQAGIAHDWVQSHMGTLVQDRNNIEQKFTAFNGWAPVANAFYASLTRMQAQMNMLGIGSNLTEMVAGIRRELGLPAQAATADQPAQHATGANAVGARAVDAGTPLPVPPTDDTVTQAGMEASAAFRVMQTSYIGLQQNVHQQRIADVNAQGDSARARLQEINEVKQFIHQVGATIDTTAAVVNGAPAAISGATEFMNRTGAQYGAMRNRRALLRGEAARWNPTYTTVNADGNMVVRNMQTGMDLDPTIAPGGEGRQTPSPGAGGGDALTMPTSIGGVMDAIADFAYRDEVQRLNQLLHSIEARCTAERVASEFLETTRRVREYKDALNAYAVKANHLQQRLAERRAQYLRFGEQMDAFASRDAASRRAGEAPGRGRERYATVFALVGSVREAIAMGRIAAEQNSLGDRAALMAWFRGIQGHRHDDGRPPMTGYGRQSSIRSFSMPQTEIDAMDRMAGQSLTFGVRSGRFITELAPVEAVAQELMASLHEGGGSHAY